jgi:hypothetical protein
MRALFDRPSPGMLKAILLLLGLLCTSTLAAPITFTQAATTHDQGAPYTIASAIDGNLVGAQGWGVYYQRFTAQTAFFNTSAPVNAAMLGITMFQNYGGNHTVQEFRLSVTNDPTPSFGSAWIVLTPSSAISSTSTLTPVGDHLRAGAPASGVATYTVVAPAPIQGITAFRIEVYPFDFGGGFGATLGRATANGNFVLSEFRAETEPPVNLALNKAILSSGLTYGGFPATNLVDGLPATFSHPNDGANTLGYFYEIDLGTDYQLANINLRNRNDGCCPERLSNYEVQLYGLDTDGEGPGALLWNGIIRGDNTNSGVGGIDTVIAGNGSGAFHGRFLRIVNHSNMGYNPQIAEVEVYGSPSPTIQSFTVSGDDTISAGQQTTLAWSVLNATSVSISPGVGAVATSGNVDVSPAATTTYTLTATNAAGSVNATVQVGVDVTLAPPVINEFAADQNTLEDEDHDTPDWIELRNPNPYRLDLAGFRLADSGMQWTFPVVTMPANGLLVVFASGKNRLNPVPHLHTNFSLSAGGETISVRDSNGTVLQSITYGPQIKNISSGIPTGGGPFGFFKPSTPGATNGAVTYVGLVGDTVFSMDRGFYDGPISVGISCPNTPDAQIRYTTNGTPPTVSTGTVYSGPIPISITTTLRAAAFKTNYAPSNVDTQTYIFPAAVLAQPAAPAGFPTIWTDAGQNFNADYQMDPEVVTNPAYAPHMQTALKSIRSLSVVLDYADLWGPNGLYMNPQQRGLAWERASSIELINPPDATHPNGSTGFRETCGLRIYGFGWRSHGASLKHAFRLKFKDVFGAKKLEHPLFPGWPVEKFDNIILRSQGSRGWNDFRTPDIYQSQYIHDSFARDTALAMGKADGPATYVHLYLNGLYWGLYNVVLRPDASFGEEHEGGTEADYDALNARVGSIEVINGDLNSWNQVLALKPTLASDASYQAFQQLVDVDNLIDYVIFSLWATNHDGPNNQNNFRALKKRTPDGRWRFYFWDMEYTLWDQNENAFSSVVTTGDTVWPVFSELKNNAAFRLRFADRMYKHCFNDGALVPAKAIARWNARADEIYTAILAESARWGDVRREPPFTRDVEWAAERTRLTGTYFPQRTAIFVSHAQGQGLYPTVAAPTLNQHGGYVPLNFNATLSAPAGTIYFTIDGTDPRDATGAPVGNQYSAPIVLASVGHATIRARALSAGTWSALLDATFSVGTVASSPVNIIFSEIHYHPVPGGTAFIELMNLGTSPVDLSGCRFTQGITYTFPNPTILQPGARLVVDGTQFSGDLSNDGETITLTQPDGITVIRSVTYSDTAPWPAGPDGSGPSLVLIYPQGNPDLNDPSNWRASTANGGSPGSSDGTTFAGSPGADADHDGSPALMEYACGTSDTAAGPLAISASIVNNHLVVTFPRAAAADDIVYTLEYSTDPRPTNPNAWQSGPAFATQTGLTATTATYTVVPPANAGTHQYVRLRVALRP